MPETTIKKFGDEKLNYAAGSVVIYIKAKPALEIISLQRPALTGVDMNVYRFGLAGKMKLQAELCQKREALSKGSK